MNRLLVALLTALAAPAALAAPPTVPELLRLVPEAAHAVVAVDAAALRTHPMVQTWLLRHHAWAGADTDARRFLADAGLDPVRDVDLIVAAAVGDGKTSGVALLAGRYDPASLGAALLKRGAQATTVAGTPAYRLPASAGDANGGAVLAQPSAELLVVGDPDAVAQALGPAHAAPAIVASEVSAGRIDVRAPFWMVATVPAEVRRHAAEASREPHGADAEAVRSVVLASGAVQKVMAEAYLDDTLRLSAAALADTAEDADLLRDAVKGALAVVRLHAQGAAPELVDVLRRVEVRTDGAVVTGKGAIPVALIEQLVAAHGGAGRHEM